MLNKAPSFAERLAQQAKKPARIYGPRARATAKEAILVKRKAGAWDRLSTIPKAFR